MQTNPPQANPETRKPPLWVIALSFFVLLAFLALVGWGLKNAYRGAIRVGEPAPQFSLSTFDGQTINTLDLRGKVVVVNFWASWCDVCDEEQVALEQTWQLYQSGGEVVFLGVDYVDTESKARAYLEEFQVSYPNGPDLQSGISDMYRITGVPETFIMGKDGNLVFVKIGPFISQDEIIFAVDGALAN
jgi:cytochrome c biogenesis protein CcmG/thiol:disulfide interchange protein DsbE